MRYLSFLSLSLFSHSFFFFFSSSAEFFVKKGLAEKKSFLSFLFRLASPRGSELPLSSLHACKEQRDIHIHSLRRR